MRSIYCAAETADRQIRAASVQQESFLYWTRLSERLTAPAVDTVNILYTSACRLSICL